MGKGNIAAVLVWETLILGFSGVVGGILFGMLFQRLLTLIIYRVIHFSTGFTFYISWLGIAVTAIFFGAVLPAQPDLQPHPHGTAEPHRHDARGKRRRKRAQGQVASGAPGSCDPGRRILYRFAGHQFHGGLSPTIFSRCSSSSSAPTASSPRAASPLLKILKKNKRYYYQTGHFITISGMLYRMKRNAVGLAYICILCTMTLVMISGTVSLYLGTEGVVEVRTPADWTSTLRFRPEEGEPDFDGLTEKVEEIAASQGVPATESYGFLNSSQDLFLRDGALDTCPLDEKDTVTYDAELEVLFISLDAYNHLTGQSKTLGSDQVLVWCQGWQLPDTLTLSYNSFNPQDTSGEPRSFEIKEFLDDFPVTGGWSPMISANNAETGGICVVVPDDKTLLDLYEQFQTANGGSMEWTLFTTLSGTEEEKLEAYYNTFADYSGENYLDFSGTGSWLAFSTESKAMNMAEGYNMNGGFFFLGVFLGVLFLMAAVLIIYYKQISEGYEDRQRFQIMQKVGLERRQIKKSINRQILVVFFLPLLVAALHLLFDYRLMVLLLQLFAMNDLALSTTCSLATFGVFAVLYVLVYRITARSYYKIVS